MNKIAIGLSLAALAVGGVAIAEQATQPDKGWGGQGPVTRAEAQQHAAQMFDRMDANHDGKLDQSDRDARRAARRTAIFERLDANHDSQISRDEFINARMGPPMRGGPDGMEGRDIHGPGMGHHGMGHHGGGMRGLGMMMGMADTNKDGAVSKDEFTAAMLQHFDKTDANHDGTVTPDERRTAREAMRQHMREGMGGYDGHGQMGGPGAAMPPPSDD